MKRVLLCLLLCCPMSWGGSLLDDAGIVVNILLRLEKSITYLAQDDYDRFDEYTMAYDEGIVNSLRSISARIFLISAVKFVENARRRERAASVKYFAMGASVSTIVLMILTAGYQYLPPLYDHSDRIEDEL